MEAAAKESAEDVTAQTRWGRYNVNYLEAEEAGVELTATPTGNNNTANKRHQHPARTRASSVRRHASDGASGSSNGPVRRASVSGRPGNKTRQRVGRRQSDGHVTLTSVNSTTAGPSDSKLLGAGVRHLEPCLRLSVIRREMSERKKRVAFSDAPAILIHFPSPPPLPLSPRREEHTARRKDGSAGTEENGSQEVLTPKERRRRKVVMAVVCTTFILLTASALFVLITLFNASAIDEAGTFHHVFLVESSSLFSLFVRHRRQRRRT